MRRVPNEGILLQLCMASFFSEIFPASISLVCKRLPPRQTIFIQIRLLTNTHSAVASSNTKSRIVENGGVVDSTVIPYGYSKHTKSASKYWRGERERSEKSQHTNIKLPLPPEPELRIMLLNNHLQKPILQAPTLVGRHVVDLRHVVADGEEALPACDGVCAHHGMRRCQGLADVVRRAARGGVQLEALFAGYGWEAGLGEGCCEGFEEGSVGGGDFVVDFAGGGPDCVLFGSAYC